MVTPGTFRCPESIATVRLSIAIVHVYILHCFCFTWTVVNDDGEPRMAGDNCRPEESMYRCVHPHSRKYLYIYMTLWHS